MSGNRWTRRWRIVAVVLLTAAGALVVGLSSTQAARSATTITVLVPASGLATGFNAVVANYERANPNIKVQVTTVPSGATYTQTLLTELQAGTLQDIIYTNAGLSTSDALLTLARAGKLANLSASPWASRVPAAAHDQYYLGKKLYGLPLDLNPLGVVYNVAKFKSLGLTPPTTFSGLLNLCRTIKAKGTTPIAVPGQFPRLLGEMLAASAVYSKTPTWNTLRTQKKVTFAGTPGWTTAIQHFVDMNNAGCFPPGVQAVSVPQSFALVGSGQALMYTGPASGMGSIQKIDPSLQLAMFPLPGTTTATTRLMAGTYDCLAVNAQTHQKAAAIQLVNFFGREGQSKLFAKVAGGISLHDANVGTFPSQFSLLAPMFKVRQVVPRAQDSWPNGVLLTSLDSALTGSITGQLSIPQGLQGMDKAWDTGVAG